MKYLSFLIFLLSFGTLSTYGQTQVDVETKAINNLIDEYSALEDLGDEILQAKLMDPDRIWIVENMGRRTNQSLNIKIQQAGQERNKAYFHGVQFFTDARDRLIKFYGDGSVAVASFYWYRSLVIPADMPKEKLTEFKPLADAELQPSTFTLVLEKQNGNWKIVHTHISSL